MDILVCENSVRETAEADLEIADGAGAVAGDDWAWAVNERDNHVLPALTGQLRGKRAWTSV